MFEAQQQWALAMERNPVDFLGRHSAALLAQSREALARTLGASGADLVYVPNATTGVNIVAQSFALTPGDEVLGTDLEYGACEAAWQRACARQGAVYRRVSIPLPYDAGQALQRLLNAITPRTRLVFISHITSATALTLPVQAICAAARERGIATLVDGAHAPGQIDLALNAIGADFYVGNAHKWLCAPKGSGFLHARPEHHARLDATVVSWGYTEARPGDESYLGRGPLERRLQWQGTRDLSAWLAVPSAIDFQARHDWPSVRARCHALAREAHDALVRRHGLQPVAGDGDWAQMVAIPAPAQDAGELQRRLWEDSRIEVPVTTHDGRVFVRVSIQGYNTADDVERLLAAPALR